MIAEARRYLRARAAFLAAIHHGQLLLRPMRNEWEDEERPPDEWDEMEAAYDALQAAAPRLLRFFERRWVMKWIL